MSNIKVSKSTKLMGFLFYLPVAFDNIDLPLLNPNFTGLIITGLNVSTSVFSPWPYYFHFVSLGSYFETQFIYYHLHVKILK